MDSNAIKQPVDARFTSTSNQPAHTAGRLADKFNPVSDDHEGPSSASDMPLGQASRGNGAQSHKASGKGRHGVDLPAPDARLNEHTQQAAQRKDSLSRQQQSGLDVPADFKGDSSSPHRADSPGSAVAKDNTAANRLIDRFNSQLSDSSRPAVTEAHGNRPASETRDIAAPSSRSINQSTTGNHISETSASSRSTPSLSTPASSAATPMATPGADSSLAPAVSARIASASNAVATPTTASSSTSPAPAAQVSASPQSPAPPRMGDSSTHASVVFRDRSAVPTNTILSATSTLPKNSTDRSLLVTPTIENAPPIASRAAFGEDSSLDVRSGARADLAANDSISIVDVYAPGGDATLDMRGDSALNNDAAFVTKQSLLLAADVIRETGGDEALLAKITSALLGDTPVRPTSVNVTHDDVAIAFAQQAFLSAKTHLATNEAADASSSLRNPQQPIQELATEFVNALRLAEHFARLEQQSGPIVRRAEASLVAILSDVEFHLSAGGGAAHIAGSSYSPSPITNAYSAIDSTSRLLLTATELLRDLRSGAFLSAQDARAPFTLTGQARVASEMMTLMHLLDRVQAAQKQMKAAQSASLPITAAGNAVGEFADLLLDEAAGREKLSPVSLPTLPGRAAVSELPSMIESFAGEDRILRDSYHNPLFVTREGTPLELGDLVWHAGGDTQNSAIDSMGTSPLLLYGFDALYSLIGFDGRSLAPPAFLLVQTEFNDAASAPRFGYAMFSESWLRAIIERLKDAASSHHNLLGEALEESLTSGGFHQVLLRGSADYGRDAADSFTFAPVFTVAAHA